jgi:hypothetical protein
MHQPPRLTMNNVLEATVRCYRKHSTVFWLVALVLWLVIVCMVPNPHPLGAPDWSVKILQSKIGLREPTARAAATFVLRAVGVGMIGILAAMSARRMPLRYATPMVLTSSPLLAITTKSINFGYWPVAPQLHFIATAAFFGGLIGLAIIRSRTAIVLMLGLGITLFAWGTSTSISDDLDQAARVTGLYLLDNANDITSGDEAFAQLVEKAFAYAQENSEGTNAILPNKAAILALGVILGDDRVSQIGRRELEPLRDAQRLAIRHRVTMHGRSDLSKHFWVSAALTVLTDEHRALTVGIIKELQDSTSGGSGFSFVDMAANKTGIRFAVVATGNADTARSLQARIARGIKPMDFFPDIDGLTEGITAEQFHDEYGGLGGARTQAVMAEIDRRILQLAILSNHP